MITKRRRIAIGSLAGLAWAAWAPPSDAADPRPPASSRILEIYETEADQTARTAAGAAPALDLAGYRRPDMIGYIYAGQFALVPATGLDNLRYYAQAVGDLAARCPGLQLESAKFTLVPYLLSGVGDLVERFQTGRLSRSEVLQAAWMAMLGLNQRWSCTYDPSGPLSRDQAQAQCDEAGRARSETGVLPSLDAAVDTTLFLGRHGCHSAEARRLAGQLVAFGREAHTRRHFTPRMPAPDSAAGRAYAAIFENCTRPTLDDGDYEWCGCYVRTLHSLSPPARVLEALAANPFVDGSTYMGWVARNLDGGSALYDCAEVYRGRPDWRESHAPRPTACLIDEMPVAAGARHCRYRAAWGEFTLTVEQCPAEITSRRWGYREVDCGRGGAVAAAPGGPREWRNGAYTMVDYEAEVAPDFVPPLPADAREKYPLEVRLLTRETPGLLKSMVLVPLTVMDLMTDGLPIHEMDAAAADIHAIDREGSLLLVCKYKAAKGERRRAYWYQEVPRHIREGRVTPAMRPYFEGIGGSAETCPARDPAA